MSTQVVVQLRQVRPQQVARTVVGAPALRVLGGRRYARLSRFVRSRMGLRTVRASDRPSYNCGVWLRHLSEAHAQGLPCEPDTVCEIGPGATIGAGLAALITGAERYVAVDGAWLWDAERNLAMFDALVGLLRRREPPAEFPSQVLTDERMERALEPPRLRRIRESIARVNREDSCVQYVVQRDGDPMHELDGSVAMAFSQNTMEHIAELSLAYRRMSRWLAPGGFVSHQIDFRCHGAARDWNGHWAYSDPVWALIWLGREPLINRVPCSEHLRLMRLHGFDLVTELRQWDGSGITQNMLASSFQVMSEDDLTTQEIFVQAVPGGVS